ncbi:MAG: protein kinase, partial [Magnetococcales bacterium]|nr:protein kinase [Magnetococcales bacterium]
DGNVPPERFRDRIVLIGPTTSRQANALATPAGRKMSSLEIHAQTVNAVLNQQHFRVPGWAAYLNFGLYGVVTLLLLLAPPGGVGSRLSTLLTAILLGLGIPVLEAWLMDSSMIWVPMINPLALLLAGFLLPFFRLRRFEAARSGNPAAKELHRTLLLIYQGQKRWEQAMAQFRLTPMDPMLLSMADTLARDLERAGRHEDAARVYQRMQRFDPEHPELDERLKNALICREKQEQLNRRMTGVQPGETATRQVGGFAILAELARDALGELLLGRRPEDGQPVILRLLGPDRHRDPRQAEQAQGRFLREGPLWLQLRHGGVVGLQEMGLDADPAHLVMDFFNQNGNMEHHLHPDDLLPLPLLLYIATRAALALDHVHQQGLTHGNLRPEDLLYDATTREVRIKEFGVARLLGVDPTGTGISPYAAPESVTGGVCDHRTDLYALCGILYHLLSGHPPCKGEDPEELRNMILKPAPSLTALRPGIPPRLAAIIARSLEKDPAARHQRGAELARELIGFIRDAVKGPG